MQPDSLLLFSSRASCPRLLCETMTRTSADVRHTGWPLQLSRLSHHSQNKQDLFVMPSACSGVVRARGGWQARSWLWTKLGLLRAPARKLLRDDAVGPVKTGKWREEQISLWSAAARSSATPLWLRVASATFAKHCCQGKRRRGGPCRRTPQPWRGGIPATLSTALLLVLPSAAQLIHSSPSDNSAPT